MQAERVICAVCIFAFQDHRLVDQHFAVRIQRYLYHIVGGHALGCLPAVADAGGDIRIVVRAVEEQSVIGQIHRHVLCAALVEVWNRLTLIVHRFTATQCLELQVQRLRFRQVRGFYLKHIAHHHFLTRPQQTAVAVEQVRIARAVEGRIHVRKLLRVGRSAAFPAAVDHRRSAHRHDEGRSQLLLQRYAGLDVVQRYSHHITVLCTAAVLDAQVYDYFELAANAAFFYTRNLLIQFYIRLLDEAKVKTQIRQTIRVVVDRRKVAQAVFTQGAQRRCRAGQQVRYCKGRRRRAVGVFVIVRAGVVGYRQDLTGRSGQYSVG